MSQNVRNQQYHLTLEPHYTSIIPRASLLKRPLITYDIDQYNIRNRHNDHQPVSTPISNSVPNCPSFKI